MKPILRFIIIVAGSAYLGPLLVGLGWSLFESAILGKPTNAGSLLDYALIGLMPAPFAAFGAAVVLPPLYVLAKGSTTSLRERYLGVIATGAVAGALMLAMLRWEKIELYGLGALYGGATAACWALIHWLTRSRQDASAIG